MNSIYRYRYSLIVGLFYLFAGCTEDIKPKPATYSQLLTGKEKKAWRFTSIIIVDEGEASSSINAQQVYNPCISDDLYVFYADADRTFEAQEGATKCNASDPDVYVTHTWSIVNASATINFYFPIFGAQTYTIKRLTDKSMTLEYYFKPENLSYRFTFTAQSE
jgi:hypothetical protein